MSIKPLPTELVSLVHYVELNKSGWWKRATGQIIKGLLFNEPEPISLISLKEKVRSVLGLSIPTENINLQIEDLLSRRSVVKIDGKLSLSEQEIRELSLHRDRANKEEEDTSLFFKEMISTLGINIDPEEAWVLLKEDLIKSIHSIGANTYKLLRNGDLRRNHNWLKVFLERYPDDIHFDLKKCISSLLSPANIFTKNYILRLLNAYFFVEATQLKKETISSLDNSNSKNREIKIVLDTNFVFSILGLHENPYNESAESILKLPGKVGGVNIRYYILRKTLEEFESVLSYQLEKLKSYKFSRNLTSAIRKLSATNGILAKFFEECEKNSETLSPEAYFLPYTTGLLRLLDEKNIKILEWQTVDYSQNQLVIDDILRITENQKRKPPSERKSYESILHDMIFWYSIKDNRNSEAHTALDEDCWGVSLDWSLIRFDQIKRKAKKSSLPIVMHPINFLQLIQFWIPRDEKLESGIMDSMRLPLFFGEFNAEDERITLEIITKLSTFSNITDMKVETITKVLADNALIDKIKESDKSNEVIIELIESKIAELAIDYKNQLDESVAQITQYENEIIKLKEESSNVLIHEENKDISIQKLKDEVCEKDKKAKALEKELSKIKRVKHIELMRKKTRRNKLKYLSILLLYVLCTSLIIYLIGRYAHPYVIINYIKSEVNALLIFVALCFFIVFSSIKLFENLVISHNKSFSECGLNKFIASSYNNYLLPIGVAIIAFKEQVIEIISAGLNR
ncbi:hypothetical protein [Serratia fonticola]